MRYKNFTDASGKEVMCELTIIFAEATTTDTSSLTSEDIDMKFIELYSELLSNIHQDVRDLMIHQTKDYSKSRDILTLRLEAHFYEPRFRV